MHACQLSYNGDSDSGTPVFLYTDYTRVYELNDRGQIKNRWRNRFMDLNMSSLLVYHDRLRTDENYLLYGENRNSKNSLSCIGTGTLRVAVATKPFVI